MLINTFRTLVNYYNCSLFLNSNSPKLNTSYTSNLIFFGPILVPKALFASLSRRRLIEAKRAMGTRMFLVTIILSPSDRCTQQIIFVAFRAMLWVCLKSIAWYIEMHLKFPYFVMFIEKRYSQSGGCRDLLGRAVALSQSNLEVTFAFEWQTAGRYKVSVKLARLHGKNSNSESKFESSAYPFRSFSLTPFITCNAMIKFDAV